MCRFVCLIKSKASHQIPFAALLCEAAMRGVSGESCEGRCRAGLAGLLCTAAAAPTGPPQPAPPRPAPPCNTLCSAPGLLTGWAGLGWAGPVPQFHVWTLTFLEALRRVSALNSVIPPGMPAERRAEARRGGARRGEAGRGVLGSKVCLRLPFILYAKSAQLGSNPRTG